MKSHFISLFLFLLTESLPRTVFADFFDWSNTEVQYLHGDGYQMPRNPRDIERSIITVSHADGWALGRNFFFMDTLISQQGEPSQVNVYGEFYSYFSANKITQHNVSYGIIKDINATLGVNLGENLDINPKSGTRVVLYGATIDLDLPGFKLFNIDFLCHNIIEPVSTGNSLQITPVWKLPFTLANTHWSFEGFADYIGAKTGRYTENFLAQPQLRLDVGEFFGMPKHVQIGLEYQYWHNKYGIKGFNESLPQALVVWTF
ncbi:MAG TPA: ion channel protein Tsx [Methylococcaceae bacterium]|nr:ion channel protein Tsx [Methylococcaceae bacterium]